MWQLEGRFGETAKRIKIIVRRNIHERKKINRIFFALCVVAIIAFVIATVLSLVNGNFSTASSFAGIFMLIDGEPFSDVLVSLASLMLFVLAIIGFFANLFTLKKED